MSLLTEQEIRDIARSVKDIGENSDRALIIAAESAVIEKIKAQRPVAWICTMPHLEGAVSNRPEPRLRPVDGWKNAPLYRLPEGD